MAEIPNEIPNWDDYFLGLLDQLKKRSKDPSTQTSAIIVDKNNVIVATGYNGFPAGLDESMLSWERPYKYEYVVHAETNAMLHCKLPTLEGCTIYASHFPCSRCFANIWQRGVRRIKYQNLYISSKLKNIEGGMSNDVAWNAVINLVKSAGDKLETKNLVTGQTFLEELRKDGYDV